MKAFLIAALMPCSLVLAQEESNKPKPGNLIDRAAAQLVQIQEDDGAWPYEGVYRVRRQIPVGYRVGGTAIVCTSLLYANKNADTTKAIQRGVEVMLRDLEDRRMQADTTPAYDVRIWGCLLYTSPSPRDRQKSRMPSSA